MLAASLSPSLSTETVEITRELDRGTPGEQAISSPERKTPEQQELAKRKSQYYEEAFATREPTTSARQVISNESLVLADVRTNVIISDEYTFITDLSYALSTRYQRSENSIIVSVVHSACLLYAGNFDPAYTLTISAIPSLLQPVTNKRNAILLSKAMDEGLGVPSDRGLIRFIPIAEENLATGGKTISGATEELEKENASKSLSLIRTLSRAATRRASMKSPPRGQLPTHNEKMTPLTRSGNSPSSPALSSESVVIRKPEGVQKMGRRKSFMLAVFGKPKEVL
ncbi:hypothetical protein LCER1_G002943 [Lachnellula cervina]|uniref:L-dopachrome isomerase n=1 Tax=Lachnellula cervina TaxID=1316786 RepID=A0A7D8YUF5_9HELO|nr:hypothetical protein LCER1_G002943 [Lachnellula cervina]